MRHEARRRRRHPERRPPRWHLHDRHLDDAVAAYELLLAKGWSPKQLVIAGDSAGGGLTLATLLKLRDQGRPMPAGAIALSPYADLTATAPSHAANDATDAMLSPRMLELCGRLYAGSAAPLRDPYVSPRFGDFTGLPPLLFTVDEEECLRDDTYAVLERAKAAGVATTLIARRGLLHVWPMFYPILPEARADVAKLIAFVKSVT